MLSLIWTVLKVFVLLLPDWNISEAVRHSIPVVCFNLFIGFGLVFLIWLGLISAQALLPVTNLQEVYRTAWHLWLFIIHKHGPAIFVKDGAMVSTIQDTKSHGHGVVVVDFNSAVVLEERDVPSGFSRMAAVTEISFLNMLGLTDAPVSPRAHGAGIVFTRPNERIRGVVDLRPQFRLLQKVPCYTRDGIELAANIPCIFTIGDDPKANALQVTYASTRQRLEDWRVCVFQPSSRGDAYLRLADLLDENELDEDDRKEIQQFARSAFSQPVFKPYAPLPTPSKVPIFNQDRVFAAVFAQARNNELNSLPWTELPNRVAASLYHELLPQINYDALFDVKGEGKFPLPVYKGLLKLRMRNNGYQAFRLIQHYCGKPLVTGEDYLKSELVVSEVQVLTNSRLLRDRGIRIVLAGFSYPNPVSDLVSDMIYKQRLDSWRANWEQKLEITQATRELEAIRTRSKALVEAQQGLRLNLDKLFSIPQYSEEALALRVIQSLEAAAADPKTRQLLPLYTIELMRYIHNMLLDSQSTEDNLPFAAMTGGGNN